MSKERAMAVYVIFGSETRDDLLPLRHNAAEPTQSRADMINTVGLK